MTIEEIRFTPIPEHNGHIGFVSFLYNNQIRLSNIAVYTRLNPSSGKMYRLVYPESNHNKKEIFYPIDKSTGDVIENEINSYLENVMKT